jgi:hypothetical protein
MCTVLLPPGVNPIAVNKYININIFTLEPESAYLWDTVGWFVEYQLRYQQIYRNLFKVLVVVQQSTASEMPQLIVHL